MNGKDIQNALLLSSGGGGGGASDARVTKIENSLQMTEAETHTKTLTPTYSETFNIYRTADKKTYGPDYLYAYAIFDAADRASKYYITGSAHTRSTAYPVGAFYDAEGTLLEEFGKVAGAVFNNQEVIPPAGAKTIVVNKTLADVVIDVKAVIPSSGSETIDTINDSLDNLKVVVKRLQGDTDTNIEKGQILTPESVVDGKLYHVQNKSTYSTSSAEYHTYTAKQGYYFVSGRSATNPVAYPLGAFYDANGTLLDTFGLDASTVYEELLVIAPSGTASMVVNNAAKSAASIKVMEGIEPTVNEYSLNFAEALVREARKNPFRMHAFDKGYVTFVFDDLLTDLDSIASIFEEEYNYKMGIAAIPSRLDVTATYLQTTRGHYTPGMKMRDIMARVVANGGEIMTHNSSPVVTVDNQNDFDFMYGYFVKSRQQLENAGFNIRGLIKAGGDGAINATPQIEKWLIGNYEYSNMGAADNYNKDRVSINQPIADIKAAILDAYTNNKWLRFMCHGYAFGEGQTFTGEADLREILDYCQELGITVCTYADMFDAFSSSELLERGA